MTASASNHADFGHDKAIASLLVTVLTLAFEVGEHQGKIGWGDATDSLGLIEVLRSHSIQFLACLLT